MELQQFYHDENIYKSIEKLFESSAIYKSIDFLMHCSALILENIKERKIRNVL